MQVNTGCRHRSELETMTRYTLRCQETHAGSRTDDSRYGLFRYHIVRLPETVLCGQKGELAGRHTDPLSKADVQDRFDRGTSYLGEGAEFCVRCAYALGFTGYMWPEEDEAIANSPQQTELRRRLACHGDTYPCTKGHLARMEQAA